MYGQAGSRLTIKLVLMIHASHQSGKADMADNNILDALVIGAGFSGVCAGIKLLENGTSNFAIYDKAEGIGGTWWANHYPGAACDVPSHLYCYSFEPNPKWSRLYSPQDEIQAYIEHCVDKYGLRSHLKLGRKLDSLIFDEANNVWRASFADGKIVLARFVINGSGGLHVPNIPNFEGARDFTGPRMHTAEWDDSFDPSGKNIAVIGSAASSIQAVPVLAKTAASLHLFQRTPNYIAPRNDFAYTDEQKKRFARFPWLTKLNRLKIFLGLEFFLYPIIKNEKIRRKRGELVKKYIRMVVGNKEDQDALMPDYEMGCKRILISDNFLPSLNRENVNLVTAPIERITENSIVTSDGQTRPIDAIIYATGFDLEKHMYGIKLTGQGGMTLAEAWKDGAEGYRGVMVPGFPNYFTVTGPNTGVGTTSVVFMIEQTMSFIMRCLKQAGPNKMVSVTPEACADYNRNMQSSFDDTVWASGCQSWYRKADGRIETLYPYNARSFKKLMKSIDNNHVKFDTVPSTRSVAAE
jgi:cation diffusion facilitator CzcD-associated flavoprotein CzcO